MEIVKTKKAPKAIGTYSQAVKTGRYVFTSGQIGLCPLSGKLIEGDFHSEAAQVFENLRNILRASGSSVENIIKLNIFLTNLENFKVLNEMLLIFLNNDALPARSTIEVSRLPMNARIEIDAIAELL